jgi:SlyX protein
MGDDRLNDLEARYAWLERHVLEQDRAMADLAEELRRVRRELEALRAAARSAAQAGKAEDEPEPPPPHY